MTKAQPHTTQLTPRRNQPDEGWDLGFADIEPMETAEEQRRLSQYLAKDFWEPVGKHR